MWSRAARRTLILGCANMSAAVLGFTAVTEVRPEPRRVEAKASKSENSDKRVRKMYDRFQTFATIQINEQCFMTPADFLEAVTEANPRKSAFKTSYSREEMLKHLKATTPTTANADIAGDTNFFRRLGRNGLISYNEYLFLLSIITKPKQGFEVAFKMFDTDGNQEIDFEEFKVLEDIFSQSATNAMRKDRDEMEQRERFPTTLSLFFFGEDQKGTLTHEQFFHFMHNLQSEVLELEFNEFARGKWEITELEFAEMLMRYTDSYDMEEQMKAIASRLKNEKGITIDEFKAFFFFLNNLEDFSKAIHYYTLANEPVGPEQFKRAVRISTGQVLSDNLVMTVYAIFDKDGDQKLSQKEFIGVMADRFARQQKPYEQIATKGQKFKRCYLHHLDHPDAPSPLIHHTFRKYLSPIPDDYYDATKPKN